MTRAENVALAQRLRADGLLLREIAERMGAKRTTVSDWLSDPDGSRLRARKDSYRGTCGQCGALTDGSAGPGRAPTVCAECLRTWDRESIIAAIQTWAATHGGYPPKQLQWSHRESDHPCHRTVRDHFGKWAEGLRAAGFRPGSDHRPETTDWIIQQIRAGTSVASITSHLGTSPSNIYNRVRQRGLRVSELRSAA